MQNPVSYSSHLQFRNQTNIASHRVAQFMKNSALSFVKIHNFTIFFYCTNQGSAAAHKPQIQTRLCANIFSLEKMDCLLINRFRHPAEF